MKTLERRVAKLEVRANLLEEPLEFELWFIEPGGHARLGQRIIFGRPDGGENIHGGNENV